MKQQKTHKMKEAVDRVFNKGIVTTVLGIVCITFCGIMLYTGKASSLELSGFFGLGLALIRSKDSLIGIKEK